MSVSLRGRVAAITGASAGIGRACALRFAANGMSVGLGARRTDRLEEVVREVRQAGADALALACDVSREADAQALVSRTEESFGRLDVVVCNAGIGFNAAVEDTTSEIMQRLMAVNFMGTYFAARAGLAVFRRQGHGHLLIVSSILGQRGMAYVSGYSASKFAQVGFAESLRAEFNGTGIRISVVCPVSTETEFAAAMLRNFGRWYPGAGPRQSADDVARAMVACLKHPRPVVYPYRLSQALVLLNAVVPGFCDRMVKRFRRHPAEVVAGRTAGGSLRLDGVPDIEISD